MRLMAPTRLALLHAAALLLACGPRSAPHVDAGTDADLSDDVGPDDTDVAPDAPADGDVGVDADVDAEDVDGGTESCGQETWLRRREGGDRWQAVTHFDIADNGDILATGSARERAWVARFSPYGAILWQRWLGPEDERDPSTGHNISELESGDLVLVSCLPDLDVGELLLGVTRLEGDGEPISSTALGSGVYADPMISAVPTDEERLVIATDLYHGGALLAVHDMSAATVRRITFEPLFHELGGLVPRSDGTLWLAASASNPSASILRIGVLLLLSAEGDVLASYAVEDGSSWRITAAGPFGEDGVMLVGEVMPEGSTDIWVHALDADAEPVWSLQLGEPGDGAPSDPCWPNCSDEHGLDVARLTDDTYVVVGTERSTLWPDEGRQLGWMVWLFDSGDQIRQVHLGEPGTTNFVQAVAPSPTGMVVGGQLDFNLFVASLGPRGQLDGDCPVLETSHIRVRPRDLPIVTDFEVSTTVEEDVVRPLDVVNFDEPFSSTCLCPE